MSALATKPASLTPEQLQAIIAQAVATATGGTVPSLTEKKPKLDGKSRSKPTPKESAGKEPQAVSKLDQQLALDRDTLVADGHRILGAGMTIERINFGMRVLSWARATSTSNGAIVEQIAEMGLSIMALGGFQCSDIRGKKHFSLPILTDACKLAILSTYCQDVGKLDWYCASMFARFLGKKFTPLKQEILQLDACKAIIAKLIKRDSSLMKPSGKAPDRKLVRAAIDAILGGRKAREVKEKTDGDDTGDDETTGGVTSIHAVSQWLAQATDDDILQLANMLGDDVKCRMVDSFN